MRGSFLLSDNNVNYFHFIKLNFRCSGIFPRKKDTDDNG